MGTGRGKELRRDAISAWSQVVACGYTIAPLQPKYQAPGGSAECLVTMVLKLNPGGWLGFGRQLRTSGVACAVANHCYPLHNSYVEPLLLSVITLRDKVCLESMGNFRTGCSSIACYHKQNPALMHAYVKSISQVLLNSRP